MENLKKNGLQNRIRFGSWLRVENVLAPQTSVLRRFPLIKCVKPM